MRNATLATLLLISNSVYAQDTQNQLTKETTHVLTEIVIKPEHSFSCRQYPEQLAVERELLEQGYSFAPQDYFKRLPLSKYMIIQTNDSVQVAVLLPCSDRVSIVKREQAWLERTHQERIKELYSTFSYKEKVIR